MVALPLLALGALGSAGVAQRPAPLPRPVEVTAVPDSDWAAMVVAEDGRVTDAAALGPILRGLGHPDPLVAARAIRAIGRFQRPALAGRILVFLADPRPPVRIATAHALGQIGQDTAAEGAVAPVLIERLGEERDPAVLAALARSVGRLPYRSPDRARAAQTALVTLTARPFPADLSVELARSLESLIRRSGRLVSPQADLGRRLATFATFTDQNGAAAARVRRAAAAALIRAGGPDRGLLVRLAGDPDAEVRRLATIWAVDSGFGEGRRTVLAGALVDRDPQVRVEALRGWGRTFQGSDCGPVIAAARDPSHHVALEALARLGERCADSAAVTELLWGVVDSLAATRHQGFSTIASWHRGATALVSLARVAPARARTILSRLGASRVWQVRMYAARAALAANDPERLLSLVDDPEDNVREAVVTGLVQLRGHAVDSIYRSQLARPDYQLVMTAAAALEGTTDPRRAGPPLLAALLRITRERKETSRDVRLALLARLAEVGRPTDAPTLEPLLADFDPVVASRVAEILSTWTGQPRVAAPRPLPRWPIDPAAIDRLRGARLRVTMAPNSGGGRFEIALDPELAPVTVARIATRARQGYYDGLTFHRVVANFVLQGGSPRANEYAGDALYMRDEVGPVSHERGTLGISTRGRDTGDAQIFVNLVDNLRLDFDYTVWGRIVTGMAVVDAILEGDVIDRIDVVEGGEPESRRGGE